MEYDELVEADTVIVEMSNTGNFLCIFKIDGEVVAAFPHLSRVMKTKLEKVDE